MKPKSPKESETVLSEVMMPVYANHYGNVHGGTIMKLVDDAAFAAATRHARCNIVIAAIDHMVFKEPVHMGDVLILKASINHVGRTSMEVGVRIEAEKLKQGISVDVGHAYLTMVAVDKTGKPTAIPKLILKTDEEKKRNKEALERRKLRLKFS